MEQQQIRDTVSGMNKMLAEKLNNIPATNVYSTLFDTSLNYAMISGDFSPSDGTAATLIENLRYKGPCCGSARLPSDTKLVKG